MTSFERIGKALGRCEGDELGLTELIFHATQGEPVERLAAAAERKKAQPWRRWILLVLALVAGCLVHLRSGQDINGPALYEQAMKDVPQSLHLYDPEKSVYTEVRLVKELPVEWRIYGVGAKKLKQTDPSDDILRHYPDDLPKLARALENFPKHEGLRHRLKELDPNNPYFDFVKVSSPLWWWGRSQDPDTEAYSQIVTETANIVRQSGVEIRSYNREYWLRENGEIDVRGRFERAFTLVDRIDGLWYKDIKEILLFFLGQPSDETSVDNCELLKERLFLTFWVLDSFDLCVGGCIVSFDEWMTFFIEGAVEQLEKIGWSDYSSDLKKFHSLWKGLQQRVQANELRGVLTSEDVFLEAFPDTASWRLYSDYMYELHTRKFFYKEYSPEEVEEDLKPMRYAELTQELRRGLPLLSIIALLGMGGLWMFRMYFEVVVRDCGEILLDLMSWRDWAWVFLFAFCLPAGLYTGILQTEILGNIGKNVSVSYESRWLQLLAALVAGVVGAVTVLRWRLTHLESGLKLSRMRWCQWLPFVMSCFGIGVMAVGYHLASPKPESLAALAAPSFLSFVWCFLPAKQANAKAGLIYCLALRKGLMACFLTMAILFSGPLWTLTEAREAYWVEKDEYFQPYTKPFGVMKLGHKMRIAAAKYEEKIRGPVAWRGLSERTR